MAGTDIDAAPRAPADLDDIQALLRAGFAGLTEASFLLLRVADAAAARAWLAQAPVTSIGDLGERKHAVLQVALTAAGLRALGVPETVVAGFSAEFIAGLASDPARSRRLGDVGPDAPECWDWGLAEREPHVLVLLYARDGGLDALRAEAVTDGFARGFSVLRTLGTSDMKGHEPFGFLDGVSQPTIDWSGHRKPDTDADLDYGNLIAPGEFILGYRNEYGLLTERPFVDPAQYPQASALLSSALDAPGMRDLGRNGSYLVFRQLQQDVRGFWRFMARDGSNDPAALAELVVGRRMDGMPLVATQDAPIRGVGGDATNRARNQFTFRGDPDGLVCPIGAHIRRANPRTGDMPGGRMGKLGQLLCLAGFGGYERQDRVAASRFHRLLRRGREYGRFLPSAAAQAPDAPDPEAGLHFIGLAANIARQFEFIQNAWLQSSKFAGLSGEADPLTGNRATLARGAATDAFGLARDGLPEDRVAALPRFVGVRGGAYFFLPGIRALRFLAGANAPLPAQSARPVRPVGGIISFSGSTGWQEVVPDGEAAQFQAFCTQINRYQRGFARSGNGRPHRGFHVKSHTGLHAEFTVLADIPPDAKHGVFKTPRTFQARVRLSNGYSSQRPDWFPDLVGMSVKLKGVEGTKLLEGEEHAGTQDFITLNQPYLPADNPAQLMVISTAPANILTAPFKLVQGIGLMHSVQVVVWAVKWSLRRIPLRSVTTEDFYSAVPITIGPSAVKFKWQSQQKPAPKPQGATWCNYLRDDLRQRLKEGDLRFDFLAQFYVDPESTPIDGARAWTDSPFVKLAELTIPACDIDSFEAKQEERRLAGMSFNPWHAIEEHRPIGNIQRARRMVYRASAMYRAREADPPG
jgi:deferrochelatase/peroxidase EfeB